MSLIFWTTQTLILVGVSQVVWRHLKKDPCERVHLFPSKKVRPQILYWSISFTVMIFAIHMGGSWLLVQLASTAVRFVPLPIAPFVFYFPAFIPLMMVDQQISMWVAMKQVLSAIKVNFVLLLKLALTAEAVLLAFAISDVFLERLIQDTFSIPESVVIGQVIGVLVDAPIWVMNSAMMAVAYAELHGLFSVGRQEPENSA